MAFRGISSCFPTARPVAASVVASAAAARGLSRVGTVAAFESRGAIGGAAVSRVAARAAFTGASTPSRSGWANRIYAASGIAAAASVAVAAYSINFSHPSIARLESLIDDKVPVYRVALTGGPCGGKSTGMSAIKERLTGLGYDVYIVPETATQLINGGAPFSPDKTYEEIFDWEKALITMQLAMEDAFVSIAKSTKRPSIVLMDRGVMDAVAYMPKEMWEEMRDAEGWDEVSMRDKRYDAVLHLVTAADGAEKFYTTSNNQARTETPAQARALDKLTRNAWVGHAHLRVVDNKTGFGDKIKRVSDAVCRLVGEPINGVGQRRYLVESWEDLPATARTFDLEDYWLGEGIKVRKRTRDGHSAYMFSRKVVDGNEVAITERPITGREYNAMVRANQESAIKITKTRTHFVYDHMYFKLDQIKTIGSSEVSFTVVEVEVDAMDRDVSLPPFVKAAKEITTDSAWDNYALCQKYGGK